MPNRLTVVNLTDDERNALRGAVNNKKVESVLAEVKRDIIGQPQQTENVTDGPPRRRATDPVRILADTQNVSRDRLTTAKTALQARASKLSALPQNESRDQVIQEVQRAMQIIDESLELIEQQ